jgi:hypothetical protein
MAKTIAEVRGTVGKPGPKQPLNDEAQAAMLEALGLADKLATSVVRGDSQGQMARALAFVRALSDLSRTYRIKVP